MYSKKVFSAGPSAGYHLGTPDKTVPDHATPDKAVPFNNGLSYNEIRKLCLRNNSLYEDKEFPADDSSLYYSRPTQRKIVWKRPKVLNFVNPNIASTV